MPCAPPSEPRPWVRHSVDLTQFKRRRSEVGGIGLADDQRHGAIDVGVCGSRLVGSIRGLRGGARGKRHFCNQHAERRESEDQRWQTLVVG